jgi:hypothetical protein
MADMKPTGLTGIVEAAPIIAQVIASDAVLS